MLMKSFSFLTLFFLSLTLAENNNEIKDSNNSLPECPFIDPMKELEKWAKYDFKKCNVTIFEAPITENKSSVEEEKQKWGYINFGFNTYVSDKIGPKRDIMKQAHPL